MLLSAWLKFVSLPSCRSDGIRVCPRPPGNHAGKRRDLRKGSTGFQRSPSHVCCTKQSVPKGVFLGLWLLQLAKVVLSPFHNKDWLSDGLGDLPVVEVTGLGGKSPKPFKCSAANSCVTSTLPMTEVAEVSLNKKAIPGQNLSNSKHKSYLNTQKTSTRSCSKRFQT